MARRVAQTALALFLVAAAAAGEEDPKGATKHTLAELIKIAKARSRAVKVAEADREVRWAQRHEALWRWAPAFDLNYLITGAPNIQCQAPIADSTPQALDLARQQGLTVADLRQRDCVSTVDNGHTISVLNFNLSGVGMQLDFRLTQPLYTFGKIEAGVDAAQHGIAAAEAQADAARDEVEVQVARAYWGLKAARTGIATLEDVRDRLKPWREKIEKDLDSPNPQFAPEDLYRIEAGMGQIDFSLADVHDKEATAQAGLRLLCGDDADIDDEELELVDIVKRPVSYYEEAARLHRPEVRAMTEGVEALRSLARVSRSAMLPDLALVGAISMRYASSSIEDSQSAYQTHANYFGFGAYLALHEAFDFGQLARWQHAKADAEVVAAQRMLGLSGITLEINQAYNDLVESRTRVELADRLQHKMRGWFFSVDNSLVAQPGILIESARYYFDMRSRFLQAIYDSNVNTARLRRASGVEVAR